ncbi:flavodoxin [Adlercreutzia equolifaciens]|uniref:flavodoxin n=1 Tax=Adlercreutzia equolifaciens TaxID=446660 RepID=UPI0023B1D25F|nr:flavodoxin [Adlercreutzia equolifaciens]MDE8702298.1 flavodoxin [Adlercreutzia equolifaciens]
MITRRTFVSTAVVAASSMVLGGCAQQVEGATSEFKEQSNAPEPQKAPAPSTEPYATSTATDEEAAQEPTAQNDETASKVQEEPMAANNILIAYFSNTGHTQAVAEKLAAATEADLFRIEPAVPYTEADLDYNDDSARCMRELNDPASRPEITGTVPDWGRYDTVFLGYPIWWSRTPPIMQTFVESYDWAGKTVVPFCTSGSSSLGSSASVLADAAPEATWLSGQRFAAAASESELASWVEGLGI